MVKNILHSNKGFIKNRIRGFSLAEALITLLIIAILAVLSAPLLMKKHEKKEMRIHGIWECNLIGSRHVQTLKTSDNRMIGRPISGDSCTFKPPSGSKDFYVEICGSKSEDGCRSKDGYRTVMFYNALNTTKNIKIENNKVYFGTHAFSYADGTGGSITIVY